MSVHYADNLVTVHHGDCLDILRTLPDSSVDAICTDPPYGLGFMGKDWDDLPPGLPWAQECLRVLRPGGHLLAFGGTRTWHRLACAVEDAGFEVRDSIAWLYGSGFPKSLDVSKAIDKAAGAEREVVGFDPSRYRDSSGHAETKYDTERHPVDYEAKATITAPATDAAREWQGWGTALKPAFEPVVVARKSLVGTVAANVLAHGTGALNIDASRIGTGEDKDDARWYEWQRGDSVLSESGGMNTPGRVAPRPTETQGRWPANVALDSDAAAELDRQSGTLHARGNTAPTKRGDSAWIDRPAWGGDGPVNPGDSGGASRFFYVAKAPARERPKADDGTAHPTVKPLALMRWLVRLVTPPGGVVLEPFAGSGTTVEACLLEGFRCIAVERQAEYLPLIDQRIRRVMETPPAPPPVPTLFDGDDLFGGVA